METTLTATKRYAEELLAEAENQLSGISNPEPWLLEAFGGSRSSSGVRVSTDSVLGLPAAWRSVELICCQLAKMPAEVHKRENDNSFTVLPSHPVGKLLNRFCGMQWTPFVLRQTLMLHALLEGNGRAYIMRDGRGDPESLTIMQPKHTYTIVINGSKYHVVFFTRDQYGDTLTPEVEASMRAYGNIPISTGNGSFFTIPDSDVLHIPGLSYNGLWGLPLVSVARDIFGNDQSAHDAVSYQFANGGRPSVMLTAPRGLFPTEKQAREFMTNFRAGHQGTKNAGKIGMLREGMTADTLGAGNSFAGLTDLTSASREDVALLFGTEYLMGQAAAVYKDLQARMTAFYQLTLDRWAEVWEQEGGRKLLNWQRYMAGSIKLHLDPTNILRGTPNELADYTGKLRTQGLISGNEGRDYHNLPPVPELDDDYGNPAITPGGEEQQTEPEREQAPDSEAENRLQRSMARHFKSMIGHECRRVMQFSEATEGFCDRIDEFYGRFEESLADLCEDLLIQPDLAEQHCNESRAAIMEVAGTVVDAEQLNSNIKTLVSNWSERHAKFTDL